MTNPAPRLIALEERGVRTLLLEGEWNLKGLTLAPELAQRLERLARTGDWEWDLRPIAALDSAGAYLLWRAFGGRLPPRLQGRPEQLRAFEAWQKPAIASLAPPPKPSWRALVVRRIRSLFGHLADGIGLLGQVVLDLLYVLGHPRDLPWREISAHIHETGGRALGITALVGFLIGIVVSYLSSLQLQALGAQIYIVDILGMSIIRELGPLLAAILVAGRSGSAMTARLGVMRLTQELDALEAMGISRSLRLVQPKVVALVVGLPLLVVWTDLVALCGGALSARLELDIGLSLFVRKLPDAVPVANYLIGLGKAAVFGLLIALVACHFGARVQPDTESLGRETTNSVVAAITLVILMDAVFAILFRGIGMP
nr:ABC transporter system permease protein [uncultured Gammaproteobacteria bacterium]